MIRLLLVAGMLNGGAQTADVQVLQSAPMAAGKQDATV